jgi:hypothetical protein
MSLAIGGEMLLRDTEAISRTIDRVYAEIDEYVLRYDEYVEIYNENTSMDVNEFRNTEIEVLK